MQLQPSIAGRGRRVDQFCENLLGAPELQEPGEGRPELDHELGSFGGVRWKQGDRSLEQVGCARVVAAGGRPASGPTEPLGGSLGQLRAVLVEASEVRPIPGRLLQVVAGDLVEAAPLAFQPADEALVQLRPKLLRHRPVGRVADEQVAEAIAVRAGEGRPRRPDQILADE